MNNNSQPSASVAIACGGTGGHLFPGIAVAEQLRQRGCAVTLLISPKDVDQHAVKAVTGVKIATLPAVGLSRGRRLAFARGFAASYRAARSLFKTETPDAVLAMGGFTAAPPVLAGRAVGAVAFLHESNTIPGRANRWLSRLTCQAFVGFPEASSRLRGCDAKVTGTPVRSEFKRADVPACRVALGLEPRLPVLVVIGGSQGASALNDLIIGTLPLLARLAPELQVVHLTGPNDVEKVQAAYTAHKIKAIVRPFFAEMHVALGAASAAVSRAGASSMAELAAMRVPAILVPYPAAMANHQYFNALAFEKTGAARLFEQKSATPEMLLPGIVKLVEDAVTRKEMRTALGDWHAPRAAERIADNILQVIIGRRQAAGRATIAPSSNVRQHQSALT